MQENDRKMTLEIFNYLPRTEPRNDKYKRKSNSTSSKSFHFARIKLNWRYLHCISQVQTVVYTYQKVVKLTQFNFSLLTISFSYWEHWYHNELIRFLRTNVLYSRTMYLNISLCFLLIHQRMNISCIIVNFINIFSRPAEWNIITNTISIIIARQTNQHRSLEIFLGFLLFPDVRVSLPNDVMAIGVAKTIFHRYINMYAGKWQENDFGNI